MSAFIFSCCAKEEKPDNETTRLLEKTEAGKALTREEKDRVADILYGTFSNHSATYRLAGWAWPMARCLPRILVNFTWDNHFIPYHAPDKTSLRKALLGPIREMIYA